MFDLFYIFAISISNLFDEIDSIGGPSPSFYLPTGNIDIETKIDE